MATIVKRDNGSYSVVYRYVDENGKTKQKWESFSDHKTAKARKAEVENQQIKNTFVIPKNETLEEFLKDFVDIYAPKKWGLSIYDSNTSLINNYINPIIGNVKIQKITPRVIDKYIQTLKGTPAVSTKTHKARTEYVTDQTIDKICRLLKCAFNQAVKWEIIGKNPMYGATLPKIEYEKRDIWDIDTIRKALDECQDGRLYVAINLAFSCSLRAGEILGLQWERVHISDKDIVNDNAYIEIDRELERVSLDALNTLDNKDIYHIFQPLKEGTTTRRVLKAPKTKSSVRRVWLPVTVAHILRKWREQQEKAKAFLGNEYHDFDLVVALDNGYPCENRILEESFKKLKEKAGLPNVVFHSLRHSSTTYKLMLSKGDIKSVQGDTGHATADMVTRVYAHVLDENRKENAKVFEQEFYSTSDLKKAKPIKNTNSEIDVKALLEQLQKSPDLIAVMKSLLDNGTAATGN
ncbi:MAG: site-specific integrase [Lachnospiraceae bacterium]|nr:site-specific integrase [Lachnospiraceae bacterium]